MVHQISQSASTTGPSTMYRLLAFSVFALFVVQGYGLEEEGNPKRNLVGEWLQSASATLERESRNRRDAPAAQEPTAEQQLQNILQGFNEGLKNVMANVSSSQIYQEMQKIGENLGAKGKELVGQLQQQVNKLQTKQ